MATDRPEQGNEDEQQAKGEADETVDAPVEQDDEVDEQSEQSFPASDPPSY